MHYIVAFQEVLSFYSGISGKPTVFYCSRLQVNTVKQGGEYPTER